MEFPAYVPAAVREKIAHYLEGENERGIPGYVGLLATAQTELTKIEQAIEARIRRGEVEYLPSLNQQKTEAAKHRNHLSNETACLKRFAHDPRMRDAYVLLTREFARDEQWSTFIFSAWVARMDYGSYRDKLKLAGELKAEIADTALKLAQLLDRFSQTGVNGPDEFYSIPELLRRTDNAETQAGNLHMWRALRGRLLGDLPRTNTVGTKTPKASTEGTSGEAPTIVVRFVEPGDKVDTDPEQQGRDLLQYVWQLSPDLSALLETLAKTARDFRPSETGMVGAAVSTRQRSAKTEFLRAFAHKLADARLTLTPGVMQAMAIVANVAINLPDVDVSYDDVRKALVKLSAADPPENSKAD